MRHYSKQLFVIFSAFLLISTCQVLTATAQKTALTRFSQKAPASESQAAPSIKSNKKSYSLGENAIVNGSGFKQFEEVAISVELNDETAKNSQLLTKWTGFADENGNVSFDWRISINGDFKVSVSGTETGNKAEAAFLVARTVEQIDGNPKCKDLNSNYLEFKVDPPVDGTYTFTDGSGNKVTVDFNGGGQQLSFVDFQATTVFDAIIVKGGTQGANVYFYNPEQSSDTGLSTPNGQNISHVSFCYEPGAAPAPATINIIKDSRPATSSAFNFTASGQVAGNFSLVDNNPDPNVGSTPQTYTGLTLFGAANTVTITEAQNVPFYSLTNISCTSSGGTNNNNINLGARNVQIQLEPGETVTCTFRNEVTTAASASVSGLVMNDSGRSFLRSFVTIQNLSTMETQTVQTSIFGRYQFDNLAVGDVYVVTVRNKKGMMSQSSQTFVLNGNLENLNFNSGL